MKQVADIGRGRRTGAELGQGPHMRLKRSTKADASADFILPMKAQVV